MKTGSETQPAHTRMGDGDTSHPPTPPEIKWLERGASKLARVYPAQPICNTDLSSWVMRTGSKLTIHLRMRCAIQPFPTFTRRFQQNSQSKPCSCTHFKSYNLPSRQMTGQCLKLCHIHSHFLFNSLRTPPNHCTTYCLTISVITGVLLSP